MTGPKATVLAHSLAAPSQYAGRPDREVITLEATYNRSIHSEWLTHCMFARNSASSRAIPNDKMRRMIQQSPFMPLRWQAEQGGMQGGEDLPEPLSDLAYQLWMQARDYNLEAAHKLHNIGQTYGDKTGDWQFKDAKVHKTIPNRLTEAWMWITVIYTGNRGAWENFFNLRCHPAAEIHMQQIAYMCRDAIDRSKPKELFAGEWHLPMINDQDIEEVRGRLPAEQTGTTCWRTLAKIAVGRCARVSYLTHHGTRDLQEDINLHDKLMKNGHWSPFEHVARVDELWGRPYHLGGKLGPVWVQYRKEFANEYCIQAPRPNQAV
jgi:hypothetical protein